MKIPTRLRKENENQAHYRLQWQSAFGKTILETFLDEKEKKKIEKYGVICELI